MMRVTTLKASVGGLANLLGYYCGLAERAERAEPEHRPGRGPVDYYLDPDEPAGRWWGRGCGALGVGGEVEAEELRAVLEARHPDDGRALGRGFGEGSVRGFDATFSAPKSVSVLWALTPDPWVRTEVLAAHDRAVDAALAWFEQHGAVTRRGRDGVHQVDTQGVAVAVFRQHTSRTLDPQLHTHAVISAKVQDPTGRWLSLDARFLKYQQRTIGWVYDAALRSELTQRLGVDWGPLSGGQADLTCIPEPVREAFSSRTAQVQAARDELVQRWVADHPGAEPDARTIARLERAAVLASRPAKTHGVAATALHATWQAQAEPLGLTPDALTPETLATPAPSVVMDDRALAAEALRRASEEAATWLPADLARHLATLLPPHAAATAAEVVEVIDRITAVAVERCVELHPTLPGPHRRDGRSVAEHVTDRHLTTRDVLAQEERLQNWARTYAHHPPADIEDPQAEAAQAIAGTSTLVVVVGPAGTGKTHTTARAIQDLHAQGRTVVGLAPSGKAADVLHQEAGCPTDTLAGFLTRHHHQAVSPWPVGTTVILDEAGMATTADLAQLASLVRRNHWRLVAIGDPAQLPPVGRGGTFAHWIDTLPHHLLDTPRRFHEPWEAAATLALRSGDPTVAQVYEQHGRLHSTHPALLPHRIATEHQQHVAAGRTVTITTSSTDTARAINTAIQHARLAAVRDTGRDPDRDTSRDTARDLWVPLHDGTHALVGDQVGTRRNDPTLVTDRGERVRNRQTWTLTHLHPDGAASLHHPERGHVDLPSDYLSRHVELGWAVTGYGTQGDTVGIGLAVLEAGATRNHTYVALTRGRNANHAWVPDPTGAADPADVLANAVATDLGRHAALSTLHRLHHEAGLPTPAVEQVLHVEPPALEISR